MSSTPLAWSRAAALRLGRRLAFGLLFTSAIPERVHAEAPVPVAAVFDVESRGGALSPTFVATLGDRLAAEVLATGRFQVVPRDALRNRLATAKGGSFKSCFAESCQIELGRELGAQRVWGALLVQAGPECHLALRMNDLGSAHGVKAATVAGGCSEDEVLATIKLAVRKLVGVQLKRPDVQLPPQDASLVAVAVPEGVPPRVRGLDFGQVDVEALEAYDQAVRTEEDATSTARQKVERWKAVEAKAPEYAAIARERQRVWSRSLQIEEDAARARAQLDADWGKLSRLLRLSVVPEADKVQWALAFVEAYGADPQQNPYLEDKLLQSFLRVAEWRPIEAQVANAPGSEETTRRVIQFLVRHPDYRPAKEAFNRLRRTQRQSAGTDPGAPSVHN